MTLHLIPNITIRFRVPEGWTKPYQAHRRLPIVRHGQDMTVRADDVKQSDLALVPSRHGRRRPRPILEIVWSLPDGRH